jgi:hypothetical protein
MRKTSNRSIFILFFIILIVFAVIAYRTKQIGFRDSLRSRESSSQTESVDARIGPPDIYPDPVRTPGAVNPDIHQDGIEQTICNPHWSTRSIRPSADYTNRLKFDQIAEYGDLDTNPRDYEEDHLIPLELGGNPTDPHNLWPEPYETSIPDGGARSKDAVENYLHREVCTGYLTLEQAQREIVSDWYRVYVTSVRRD